MRVNSLCVGGWGGVVNGFNVLDSSLAKLKDIYIDFGFSNFIFASLYCRCNYIYVK